VLRSAVRAGGQLAAADHWARLEFGCRMAPATDDGPRDLRDRDQVWGVMGVWRPLECP
jgi:hypothetical protein